MKEPLWLAAARNKLGTHEIPGPRANEFIQQCLHSTTIGKPDNDSDETPWCSAFVNRILQMVGIKGTNSAWARSWLDWGREPTSENEWLGAVVVLERGENSGHVGFLVDWEEETDEEEGRVKLLGGNQSDSVSYAWFPMSRVLGYRVPV
jgi:uncharacterized protein (TIGR02594 family)